MKKIIAIISFVVINGFFNFLIAQSEQNGELYTNGVAKFTNGDYASAIKDLGKFINLNEQNKGISVSIHVDDSYWKIGLSYFRLRNFSLADEMFNKLIPRMSYQKEYVYYSYVYKGLMKYFDKKYAEAISDFSLAIESYKKNTNAYLMRGICNYNKYSITQSAADSIQFTNDFNIVIKDKKAKTDKAFALYYLGMKDKAYSEMKELTSDKPSVAPYYEMACLCALNKNNVEAISNIELALKNGFKDTTFLFNEPRLADVRKSNEFNDLLTKLGFKKPDYIIKEEIRIKNTKILSITDDLQTEINNAKTDAILVIPQKAYIVDKGFNIVGKKNLTLIFDTCTMILNTNMNDFVMYIENCQNIKIYNGIFKHYKAQPNEGPTCTGQVFIVGNSKQIMLQNCNINGCGSIGVDGYSSEKLVVVGCNIHSNSVEAYRLNNIKDACFKKCNLFNNGGMNYNEKRNSDYTTSSESYSYVDIEETNIKNPYLGFSESQKKFIISTEKEVHQTITKQLEIEKAKKDSIENILKARQDSILKINESLAKEHSIINGYNLNSKLKLFALPSGNRAVNYAFIIPDDLTQYSYLSYFPYTAFVFAQLDSSYLKRTSVEEFRNGRLKYMESDLLALNKIKGFEQMAEKIKGYDDFTIKEKQSELIRLLISCNHNYQKEFATYLTKTYRFRNIDYRFSWDLPFAKGYNEKLIEFEESEIFFEDKKDRFDINNYTLYTRLFSNISRQDNGLGGGIPLSFFTNYALYFYQEKHKQDKSRFPLDIELTLTPDDAKKLFKENDRVYCETIIEVKPKFGTSGPYSGLASYDYQNIEIICVIKNFYKTPDLNTTPVLTLKLYSNNPYVFY